jgi:Sensors of blue-light using FAD
MFPVSLTYTSEMTVSTDFLDILEVSRIRNERDGITGVLLFCNNSVVQCLEGSREAVNQTYARIVRDKRHQNPLLLDYRVISTRLFSTWSMGYMPESSVTRPTLLKYSVSQNFEPRLLSGESCLGMLTELTRKVRTV